MRLAAVLMIATLLAPAVGVAAAGAPLAAFKGHNPVVLMFAPSPDDSRLNREADAMSKLESAPFYQGVIVATVTGDIVMGVTDTAAALRARFGVPANGFRVVLVARNGQVALSQPQVVTAMAMKAAVDAAVKRENPNARPPARLPPPSPGQLGRGPT